MTHPAGSGRLLALAGREADIVALTMQPTAQESAVSEKVGWLGAFPALVGTTDQMCERLLRWRESLGISYVMVGDELMEGLAPVVERLTGR